jgi:hypothetical protein
MNNLSHPSNLYDLCPGIGEASDQQLEFAYAQSSLSRNNTISIIRAAFAVGEVRFARLSALAWLTAYPGDLGVSLLHAQALMTMAKTTSHFSQAAHILESLCRADPEYLEARQALQAAQAKAGNRGSEENSACVQALDGHFEPKTIRPNWAHHLSQARQSLLNKPEGAENAERLVHLALLEEANTPLAGILHIQVAMQRRLPLQSVRNLTQMYHERWPECIQFMLFMADSLMDGGEADLGVALLHQAAARDVIGQVPVRLWGSKHPYRALWPDNLTAPILQDLPVPASVAAVLGWNRLPAGERISEELVERITELENQPEPAPVKNSPEQPVTPEVSLEIPDQTRVKRSRKIPSIDVPVMHLPETLLSIQSELERVAARVKKPQLMHTDGRYPVYVIFSTRQGLAAQYGLEAAPAIETAILKLSETVSDRANWGSLVFFADDPAGSPGGGCASLGISRARASDPWSLKLALADLDIALRKRGEMIGALLIVGGPEVVPYHRLPNPVDDDDLDVPSDNPYATRDENYFVPEWPVGRLPGGCGRNPSHLLQLLEGITDHHLNKNKRKPWYLKILRWLQEQTTPSHTKIRPSMGYTAAIWRKASLSVFRPIGEAPAMRFSPPTHAGLHNGCDPGHNPSLPSEEDIMHRIKLHPVRLAYFNLHGMADASEWYGHCDPLEPDAGPDYPVALRPDNISGSLLNGHKAPQVIFSEACYGAHLEGRDIDDSVALKFLVSGSQTVVGSTCTAYGAVDAPLAAADLLGYCFWIYLTEGLPSGEALRRAKIRLAREMHRRQGYLDGEDQKTLISFVLYGDPLVQTPRKGKRPKNVLRPIKPPNNVKLVCDRQEGPPDTRPVPMEVVHYVKHIVEQYLPGMEGAELSLSQEHSQCEGEGHLCPSAQFGSKSSPAVKPRRQVVTLRKQIQKSNAVHKHFARLTLDSKGALVKLVVSR